MHAEEIFLQFFSLKKKVRFYSFLCLLNIVVLNIEGEQQSSTKKVWKDMI